MRFFLRRSNAKFRRSVLQNENSFRDQQIPNIKVERDDDGDAGDDNYYQTYESTSYNVKPEMDQSVPVPRTNDLSASDKLKVSVGVVLNKFLA